MRPNDRRSGIRPNLTKTSVNSVPGSTEYERVRVKLKLRSKMRTRYVRMVFSTGVKAARRKFHFWFGILLSCRVLFMVAFPEHAGKVSKPAV